MPPALLIALDTPAKRSIHTTDRYSLSLLKGRAYLQFRLGNKAGNLSVNVQVGQDLSFSIYTKNCPVIPAVTPRIGRLGNNLQS